MLQVAETQKRVADSKGAAKKEKRVLKQAQHQKHKVAEAELSQTQAAKDKKKASDQGGAKARVWPRRPRPTS
jgi:hypothetical protein